MHVRRDYLEGVEHYVVPVVMLTVGAHAGSSGPIFYGSAELRRSVPLWNGRPIVVYHSASFAGDPTTWNRQKVGVIFNTRFDGVRLIADAWIGVERARAVDARLADAIEARRMLEVSTGLAMDLDRVSGVYDGRPFGAVAQRLMPDHLAILPDVLGACSIADGCGLLRDAAHA